LNLQLAIQEPQLEQYFNHSKEEIIKALKFIANNNLKPYFLDKDTLALSSIQKQELHSRIETFHNNRDIGKTWKEILYI